MSSRSQTSTMVLKELADEGAVLFPLDVTRYHRMISEGILPEGAPYELLNGQLVRKDRSAAGEDRMTVGNEHGWVIDSLVELNPKLKRLGCYMRVQLPVTLPPLNEPEPDGAIVIGAKDDYHDRHPTAADVLCAIEVADSSLRRDRGTKLQVYAAAKIPVYIIINLVERVIEVYSEPLGGKGRNVRYGQSSILSRDQKLKLPTGRARFLMVPVRDLLR